MKRLAFAALMLGAAGPAFADPPAAPAPAPPLVAVPAPPRAADPAPSRPDAARLAAAERLIAQFMPPGTMREVMEGFLPDDDTLLALTAEQLGVDTEGMTREQKARAVEERGVAQDRHFRERFRIMMEVTRRITAEMMAEIEPQMRSIMATLYARQFTAAELDELSAFFRTPVGARYARSTMTIMRDPAWQEMFTAMTPRFEEMQRRMERALTEATAHLDPVPQS